MTDKKPEFWCWAPNCDGRSTPHVHNPAHLDYMSGWTPLGGMTAANVRKAAKDFAAGWNGDSHLTPEEQAMLEEEVRWAFGRVLAMGKIMLEGRDWP